MSSAISCNVDAAVQAQKRHSQVRLTRRRLWADHEGASCISKRDSSSSQTQNPGSQRPSPPSLSLEEHSEHGGAVEHACLCSECGKAFMSWKALFGHMRCHPERDWRGIQRPELSSFGLENQGRATRRLTFLNAEVKGDADKEPELQSDAEDLEAFELAQGASGISAFGKGDATSMRDRIQEAKLPAHPADIEGAEEKPVDSIKIASSANSAEQNKVNFTVWPRRKRSRRRRASSGFSAKMSSVTSETATSNQQREAEVLDTADQEDLDMANCLVLLSSADGYGDQVNVKDHRRSTDETAFICSTLIDSNQKQGEEFAQALAVDHDDVDDDNNDEDDNDDDDDDDRLGYNNERGTHGTILGSSLNVSSTMRYECSTCRRSFKSHQALGGHRASHRKTKGCFALTNPSTEGSTKEFRRRSTDVDGDDGVSTLELNHWHASMAEHAFLDTPRLYRHKEKEGHQSRLPSSLRTADQRTLAAAKKKFKGHICSICYRVFPSGQALGGHKRCHWTGEKIAESASIASSSNNKVLSQPEQAEWEGAATSISQAEKFLSKEDRIDLNLPAPLDDEDDHAYADDGGLSSSELMRPSAEYISAPVGIDEEDTIEGNLVEYISSKKRSVNQLFAELHGDGAKRVHRNSASAMTSTIESGHGAAQESSNPVQVHIQQCSALGS
ncbi:hypothetical protein KP509_20G052300 [Ceratopteris richardii]|nr:hypothetical protein KP509_20G052300 [Ceratopteris richardii]